MAWCPHCAQDLPIQRQFLSPCSYCHCSSDQNHQPWCRGPVPNAVDVCSYCKTTVFARALDAAMHGQLMAAEERGRKELEIQNQQAIVAAQRRNDEWRRRDDERRQRTIALSIAGVAVGLVVLIVVIQWARQFSGLQIAIGVIVILVIVGIVGRIAEEF